MKKTIILLTAIVLSVIGTYKAGAKCSYYAISNDSTGISEDSLERMTNEEIHAYCDSVYKASHPWIKEVAYEENGKTIRPPLRQKQNFSYSNSYVPSAFSINTSKTVGQIDIQSETSPSGARIYSVPIKSYKQDGAFCPDLCLKYNSQGGKGAYGKGWSIGGLHSIVRGNKTLYYDGKTDGMRMDADDVFYLDGIRLIRTSTTAYEYETEEGQIKAVAVVSGSVIKYFNVYFPNGYTAVFGMTSTTDNKIEYPITSLTNEKGQSITFGYLMFEGIYRPSNIYFALGARIEFSYSIVGNDYQYRGGIALNNCYLLQDIKTYAGGSLTGTYTFSYISNNNVSLLSRIDYSANGSSLNPLIFYYGDGSAIQGYFTDYGHLTNGYSYENRNALTATRGRFDYSSGSEGILFYPNKTPYYYITIDSNPFHHSENRLHNMYDSDDHIYMYDAISGNNSVNLATPLNAGSGFITMITANLDGNQQECIIKVNNREEDNLDKVTFSVYQKASYGLIQKYAPRTFSYNSIYTDNNGTKSILPKYHFPGDFNGDGKMEILSITAADPFETGSGSSMLYIYDLNNNTTLYSGSLLNYVKYLEGNGRSSLEAENLSDKIVPLDYDGDGKTDLCHIHAGGMSIYTFSQNNGSWSAQLAATYPDLSKNTLKNRYWAIGDFNGDGLTDIIYSSARGAFGNSYWNVLYSKGNGTFRLAFGIVGPDMENSTSDFLIQDVNSDGISDLIELTDENFTVYTMSRDTLTQEATQVLAHSGEFLTPVNINSSSLSTQFVSLLGTGATLYSYKTNLRTDQALTGVVNSNGVIEKNYYYTISQDNTNIYSRGYNATFPYINIFEPITVLAGSEVFVDGASKDVNRFFYSNAVYHRQGLAFRGFEFVNIINKRGQTSSNKYNPFSFSMLIRAQAPSSETDYTYTTSIASNKIRKSLLTSKVENDQLRNVTATTTYAYDTYGQVLTEQTSYSDNITVSKSYTYTNFTDINSKYHLGRLASSSVTTSRGNSQHSEQSVITAYNSNDQPLTVVNKVNGNNVKTVNMEYDSRGNMTTYSVTPYSSQTPRVSTYQYNYYDRLIKATDPLGVWKEFTYNTDGTVASTRTCTGYTNYAYDAFGRQISVTRPDTVTINTTFAWNSDNGGRYAITKSGTNIPTETTVYDALNREVRQQQTRFNGSLLKVDKQYDTYGNLWKESYPYKTGSPTYIQYSYDPYNRLETKSEAGKTTNYSYSGLSTTADDGTMSTTTTTDALGRVVSVTDPAGTINYTLNGAGNPTSVSAPSGSGSGITTSITYDTYGRRKTITDPSSGTTTYNYHSTEGYLQSETNARNQTTSYVCDIYGRMVLKACPEFYMTYTYDNNLNKITAETCSNGTSTAYSYDGLGRLSSITENAVNSKWLQKKYTYTNGRVSAIKYTSQNGVLTTENYYYANGHLTSVKLNGTTSIFSITSENNQGRVAYMSTGGISRSYSYTVSGYPISRAVTAFGPTKQSIQYSFNEQTGNLSSRSFPMTNMTEDFSYDNLNRLTGFGSHDVTYDNNGNITSKGDVGSFSYNTSGKPYAVSDVTLTNSISAGTQTVSYYSFDRPNEISDNGYTADFTYNGNYDRVKMQVLHNSSATLTRYYLGGCYELDVKPSGTTERLYLNGGYYDAPTVLIKQGSTSSVYHILRDHLGSVTHVLNSSGTVIQELSYDAWGRLRNPSTFALYTPTNEPEPYLGRGYCGHEHLTGLGLINMNARLYDPLLGRFLSPDPRISMPFTSQAYNRYSYGYNNPLVCIDRDGENPFIIIGIIIGAYVGGAVANKNQWNPLKWNYSNPWTYIGIIGGGALGGYAGSAIFAGDLTLSVGAITPFGAIGFNNWKDRNNNRRTDVEINTIAGGHWNSGEEKGVKNAEELVDNAINNMRNYRKNVTNIMSSNSYLQNLYIGTQYFNSFAHESANYLHKLGNAKGMYKSLAGYTNVVNTAFIVNEFYMDYYYDKGHYGFHLNKDIHKEIYSYTGAYVVGYIGGLISPYIAIPAAFISSFYISNNYEEKAYQNYIRSFQPDCNSELGMYNFFVIY